MADHDMMGRTLPAMPQPYAIPSVGSRQRHASGVPHTLNGPYLKHGVGPCTAFFVIQVFSGSAVVRAFGEHSESYLCLGGSALLSAVLAHPQAATP